MVRRCYPVRNKTQPEITVILYAQKEIVQKLAMCVRIEDYRQLDNIDILPLLVK